MAEANHLHKIGGLLVNCTIGLVQCLRGSAEPNFGQVHSLQNMLKNWAELDFSSAKLYSL